MFGLSSLLPATLKAQGYDSLKAVQVARNLESQGFNLEGYIIGKFSQVQIDHNDSSVVINCPLIAEKQYNDTLMDYPLFIAFNKNDSTNQANRDFIKSYGGIGFILDNNSITPEAYADSIKNLLKDRITNVESKLGKLENVLYEVYPNPSNGIVNLKYDIKNQSEITINLYDMLGRQLKTFSEQKTLPGQYIKHFETSNLPSGIYFLQIMVDSEKKRLISTKKINLIK